MPAAFRFCGQCGAALGEGDAAEAPLFRYCGECGTDLAAAFRHTPGEMLRQAAAATSATEERRRVSILFADLSGSTELADRMEAEACYRVISACLQGLGRTVTDGGGYVLKTLGDGLMALFGAPVAYGDDVDRAAASALAMQAWMAEFAAEVQAQHGVALRLRVGINYGSVVAAPVPAGDRPQYDVLGDAVNVAQRIEAAAAPETIYVSETFYRLTRGRFLYEDRGAARVKGKAEPLRVFRLIGPRVAGAEAEGVRELPLVGRETELTALRAAALMLHEHDAPRRLCAITGGSGMGKTRLQEELATELTSLGVSVLRGSGERSGRGAPLALWRSWLQELLPLPAGVDYDTAVEAVRQGLAGGEAGAWADWLTALALDPSRLAGSDSATRQSTTREALAAFLRYWQAGRPAAVLIDDAHLVDRQSLELLLAGAENEGGQPLFVALAGEPLGDYPPTGATQIEISRLDDGAVRAAVAADLPELTIPDAVMEKVIALADGSPLFLDLTLRGARESDNTQCGCLLIASVSNPP